MELVWFISGAIFAWFLWPCFSSLTELITTWLESKRMKCAESINNSNINIQKAVSSVEEIPTRQIGFSLSEEEEEFEDEDL